MPKVITSPVKRWPGTVTISDPLTFPQVQDIEAALGITETEAEPKDGKVYLTVPDLKMLPAIQSCTEKWELENFNPFPFPASPRIASHNLILWLFGEIIKVYFGELESPNE